MTNQQIADRLDLSPRTVEARLADIYARLGVNRRTQLIHAMAGGEITADGTTAGAEPAPTAARATALTPAERQVATLIAQGHSNREIATVLFLSRHTVDSHLRRIFAKLGVSSRVAIATALQRAVRGREGDTPSPPG